MSSKSKRSSSKVNSKIFPILSWLNPYNRRNLRGDLVAGLTVGVMLIPQGMAYAMIAGLPPIYGFYTAMVTPVVAALFGSSYHLISGPTTAICSIT